jgi:mannose-1-phosphate guanylyltransferase
MNNHQEKHFFKFNPAAFFSLRFWQRPQRRLALKTISLLITATFVFPYLAWAFEGTSYPAQTAAVIFNHQAVKIPSDLGTVQAAFQGKNQLVIHIQDLHCNFEVQNHIAGLVQQLSREQGLKLVAIEGASKSVNVAQLRNLPKPSVQKNVGQYLLKQGKLSGAEWSAALAQSPLLLEGVEKAELYTASRKVVGEFLNDESQGYVYDLREMIKDIRAGIYNPALLALDNQKQASRDGETPLLKYAVYLWGAAKKQGVTLAGYPNVGMYVEKSTGQAVEVNSDALAEEMEALDKAVRETLYTRGVEREFDQLKHRLDTVERLLNISAKPAELQEYRQDPKAFRTARFLDFVKQHNNGSDLNVDADIFGLDKYLEKVGQFYDLADARSAVFVENTLARMNEYHTGLAVLVTGGFHTQGILQGLKSRNVSYISVQPKITHEDLVNPYYSLLRNRRTPLEKLLAENQNILALEPESPQTSPADRGRELTAAEMEMQAEHVRLNSKLVALISQVVRAAQAANEGALTAEQKAALSAGTIHPIWNNIKSQGSVHIVPFALGKDQTVSLVVRPEGNGPAISDFLAKVSLENHVEATLMRNTVLAGMESGVLGTAGTQTGLPGFLQWLGGSSATVIVGGATALLAPGGARSGQGFSFFKLPALVDNGQPASLGKKLATAFKNMGINHVVFFGLGVGTMLVGIAAFVSGGWVAGLISLGLGGVLNYSALWKSLQRFVAQSGQTPRDQNLSDLRNVVKNNRGPKEAIAITNGGDEGIVQAAFAKKAAQIFRADGATQIVSHPEVTRRGQFLGLLDAIQNWVKAHGPLDPNAVSVGIMMPGKGTRMSPLTQSQFGIKPMLPMLVRADKNSSWMSGAEASLYTWTLVAYHLNRMGFKGMAWKWGDEPQIAANSMAGMNLDLSDTDAVRFGAETVITEDLAANKEWLYVNPATGEFKQVRRRDRAALLERMGLKDTPDAKAFVHIGSPAFSYTFLEAAQQVFGDLNREGDWIDVDGYVFEALTQDQATWETEKAKDKGLQELLVKYPDFFERVQKMKALINAKRGRPAEAPLKIRVIDFGQQLYWGDIGQLKKARETLWAVNDRVSPDGEFARKLAAIDDVKPDQWGNIVVGDSVVPQDGSVKNSVIIDTKISGKAEIDGAVIVKSQLGDAQIEAGSVVFGSVVGKLAMGKNGYSHQSIGAKVDVPADFVHTTMPVDPTDASQGVEPYLADSRVDVGKGDLYTKPQWGNAQSFEAKFAQMRQRQVLPDAVEKVMDAQRARVLADIQTAAAHGGVGIQPVKATATDSLKQAYAEIKNGKTYTDASYALQFGVNLEQAQTQLNWLAAMDRETERGEFYGVDRVRQDGQDVFRRVTVDPKLQGSYDMRGPADALWTDKAVFYAGMSYGRFLVENNLDGAFNITASHNGPADNGIKPSLRRQRGIQPIALLGAGVRLSSPRLKVALTLGLRAAGVKVYDIGTSYTPLIYNALAYFQEPGITPLSDKITNPQGTNHFTRSLDGKESKTVYAKMPDTASSAKLDALQKTLRERGNLAGFAKLEEESDLDALRAGAVKDDNAMARHHNTWIKGVVRLGPEISQYLFNHWVYGKNQYKQMIDALEAMSDAQWDQLQNADAWKAFTGQFGLPLAKFPHAPPTAAAHPFKGLKVGTDFANGSMWRMGLVLNDLGLSVTPVKKDGHDSSRPDGNFPIHQPDPTKPQFQRDAIELSKHNGGQIVFMFDEDGDRFQVVVNGRVISGAEMSALLAKALPGRVILTDVRYWRYVNDALEKAGKTVFEGPVGYAFYGEAAETIRKGLAEGKEEVVIYPAHLPMRVRLTELRAKLEREGIRTPTDQEQLLQVAMGIEGSGHAFFPSNGYANDGGYYMGMVLWFLTQMPQKRGEVKAETLARLYDELPKNPFSPPELRIAMKFNATGADKEILVQKVLNEMEDPNGQELLSAVFGEKVSLRINRMDGGKIHVQDANGHWLASALLRKSNNEPVFGTNFEGRTHVAKQRLEEWLAIIVAETTVEVQEQGQAEELGAEFAGNHHTSTYLTEATPENDEVLPNGSVVKHESLIERLNHNPELLAKLSPEAKSRLGLTATPGHAFRAVAGYLARNWSVAFYALQLGALTALGRLFPSLVIPVIVLGFFSGAFFIKAAVDYQRISRAVQRAVLEAIRGQDQDEEKLVDDADQQALAKGEAIAWSHGDETETTITAMLRLEQFDPWAANLVQLHEQFNHEFTGLLAMLPIVRNFAGRKVAARMSVSLADTAARAYTQLASGTVFTVETLAAQAGISQNRAQDALEYLASSQAEVTNLKGIDKRTAADGRVEYYAVKAPDMGKVRVVILAGGGGERVWPASDGTNPKQFQSFSPDGKSMLQKTIERVMQLGIPKEHILVATRASFVEQVKAAVQDFPVSNIVGEPAKKDTGAAIALNLANLEPGTTAVFLPADHVIAEHLGDDRQAYEAAMEKFKVAIESAVKGVQNRQRVVSTIGIKPTFPATGYGYLRTGFSTKLGLGATQVLQGLGFKEKPELAVAKTLVASGDYLWNAGMFVMQRDFGLEMFRQHAPAIAAAMETIGKQLEVLKSGADAQAKARAQQSLDEAYQSIPKEAAVSVDFAIMEKLKNELLNVAGTFPWFDEGDWGSMTQRPDARGNKSIGPGTVELDAKSRNLVVYADRGKTVVVKGLENHVVAVNNGRVLVMPAAKADKLKDLVQELNADPQTQRFVSGSDLNAGTGIVKQVQSVNSQATTDQGVVALFGVDGVKVTQTGNRVVVENIAPARVRLGVAEAPKVKVYEVRESSGKHSFRASIAYVARNAAIAFNFLQAGVLLTVGWTVPALMIPAMVLGLLFGGYLALAAINYNRISSSAERALLTAAAAANPGVREDDLRALTRDEVIAWSSGEETDLSEAAMIDLEAADPWAAEQIKFHEQFAGEFRGMLALLPGWQLVWSWTHPYQTVATAESKSGKGGVKGASQKSMTASAAAEFNQFIAGNGKAVQELQTWGPLSLPQFSPVSLWGLDKTLPTRAELAQQLPQAFSPEARQAAAAGLTAILAQMRGALGYFTGADVARVFNYALAEGATVEASVQAMVDIRGKLDQEAVLNVPDKVVGNYLGKRATGKLGRDLINYYIDKNLRENYFATVGAKPAAELNAWSRDTFATPAFKAWVQDAFLEDKAVNPALVATFVQWAVSRKLTLPDVLEARESFYKAAADSLVSQFYQYFQANNSEGKKMALGDVATQLRKYVLPYLEDASLKSEESLQLLNRNLTDFAVYAREHVPNTFQGEPGGLGYVYERLAQRKFGLENAVGSRNSVPVFGLDPESKNKEINWFSRNVEDVVAGQRTAFTAEDIKYALQLYDAGRGNWEEQFIKDVQKSTDEIRTPENLFLVREALSNRLLQVKLLGKKADWYELGWAYDAVLEKVARKNMGKYGASLEAMKASLSKVGSPEIAAWMALYAEAVNEALPLQSKVQGEPTAEAWQAAEQKLAAPVQGASEKVTLAGATFFNVDQTEHTTVYLEIKAQLERFNKKIGGIDEFIKLLDKRNARNDSRDEKLILNALTQLQGAGIDLGDLNDWAKHIHMLNVPQSRLHKTLANPERTERLGGLILESTAGEMHTVLPRQSLTNLTPETLAELLHELVEIRQLKNGVDPVTAHQNALKAEEAFLRETGKAKPQTAALVASLANLKPAVSVPAPAIVLSRTFTGVENKDELLTFWDQIQEQLVAQGFSKQQFKALFFAYDEIGTNAILVQFRQLFEQKFGSLEAFNARTVSVEQHAADEAEIKNLEKRGAALTQVTVKVVFEGDSVRLDISNNAEPTAVQKERIAKSFLTENFIGSLEDQGIREGYDNSNVSGKGRAFGEIQNRLGKWNGKLLEPAYQAGQTTFSFTMLKANARGGVVGAAQKQIQGKVSWAERISATLAFIMGLGLGTAAISFFSPYYSDIDYMGRTIHLPQEFIAVKNTVALTALGISLIFGLTSIAIRMVFQTKKQTAEARSTAEKAETGKAALNYQGKSISLTLEPHATVEGMALSQIITGQKMMTLELEGRKLSGALYEAEGKTFLQLGNRWIILGPAGLKTLPLEGVLDSEILLGNPTLRDFLGIQKINPDVLRQPLPQGMRLVTELPGIAGSKYSASEIEHAVRTLYASDLNELLENGQLTLQNYVDYLDVLMVISSRQAVNYMAWKDGMDKLQIFLSLAAVNPGAVMDTDMIQAGRRSTVFYTKLKMGYPELLMQYLAQPMVQKQIKTTNDNMGTVVSAQGQVEEGDLVNANFLDVAQKDALQAELAKRGVDVSRFASVAEIGIAGQGSRILRDYFRQNKMDTPVFEVQDVGGFKEYLHKHGVANVILADNHAGKIYTGLTMLMVARYPGAVWIGGIPTVDALERLLGKGLIMTQEVVHYLNPDGSFQEDAVDVGGHGYLIRTVSNDPVLMMRLLENHSVWHHIQGDDLGNEFNTGAMAWMIETGQTPFSPLVTPQEIRFKDNFVDAARAVQAGQAVKINGQAVETVSGQTITDHAGRVYAASEEISRLETARDEVEKLVQVASALKQDKVAQRDAMIAAMEAFYEKIYKPTQALNIEIEGKAKPLIEVTQKAGGHLLEVAGGARFVENSNYTKNIEVTDSKGKKTKLPLSVFLAIIQRDFNTNNFSLDPLAVAANRDNKIKALYHEFMEFAQAHQGQEDVIMAKRHQVEVAAAARINEIGRAEWAYRSQAVERLMLAVFPLPCEQKKDAQGRPFLKLNMMAQDVASFEAMMALSPVTAESYKLKDLDRIFAQAGTQSTPVEIARVKNEVLKSLGINLAAVPALAQVPRFKPLMVNLMDFTQAKNDFTQVNDRLQSVVGDYFNVTIGDLQRQALTGIWWANNAERLGLIGEKAAKYFVETAQEIAAYGQTLKIATSREEREEYVQKLELLHAIRELVYSEDFPVLRQWSDLLDASQEVSTGKALGLLAEAKAQVGKQIEEAQRRAQASSTSTGKAEPHPFASVAGLAWGAISFLVALGMSGSLFLLPVPADGPGLYAALAGAVALFAGSVYFAIGAVRFFRLGLDVYQAMYESYAKDTWQKNPVAGFKNFDAFKKDSAYGPWVAALPADVQKDFEHRSLFEAIAWSNGIIENEEGFRILQRDQPKSAEAVRYHEQFSNHVIGMLVLFPGVKAFLERQVVGRFLRQPEILPVSPQIQPYVWGQSVERSFILRFLDRTLGLLQQELKLAELWFGAHRKNPGIVRLGSLPMDLDRFAQRTGEKLLGPGRKEFGQLFKVLDAAEALSIQMHERFKPNSKNESWMVVVDRERLRAEGKDQTIADIYLGFRPVEQMDDKLILGPFKRAYLAAGSPEEREAIFRKAYQAALEKGRTDRMGSEIKAFSNHLLVRWENNQAELYLNGIKQPAAVKTQMGLDQDKLVINVPGATVHALAYGSIYELQETADKTLRLYDQGRNDPNRPLHIEEALSKLDFTSRGLMDYLVKPVSLDPDTVNLIRTPLYSMDEVKLAAPGMDQSVERLIQTEGSYQMLIVTEGTGHLSFRVPGQTERLLTVKRGDMLVVPAAISQYKAATFSNLTLLKAYESSPGMMQKAQGLRGGKSFWEEPGFFQPAAAGGGEVVNELSRLQAVLPEGVNQPVNQVRFWPARLLQAWLRLALFAGEGQTPSAQVWRQGASALLLAGLSLFGGVLAVFLGSLRTEKVSDDNPRLEAAKRLLVVPDAAAAKEYNIKGIRFRGLSEQGGFFQRLWKGALLGAYTEGGKNSNDEGVWATVFVPDVLLATVAQAQPVSDGTLRSQWARLNYRVQAFLFGIIAGQQTEKYYAGLRTEKTYATEKETAVAQLETLQGGEAFSAWAKAPHAKVGIHGAEMAALVGEYLREAESLMHSGADVSTASLQAAWEQNLNKGADPTLATLLASVETANLGKGSTVAALLQSLAKESAKLGGAKQALVGNGLAAQLVAGDKAPGSSNRGIETAAVQAGQEVYVMGMPETYRAMQAEVGRLRAALSGNAAWASAGAGLIARLQVLESILQSASTAQPGEMAPIAGTVGNALLGEIGLLNRDASIQMRLLGEDLTRVNRAVSTGQVKNISADGVDLAQTQVFEVNAPVARPLSVGEVMGAKLPADLLATSYAGERVAEQKAPAVKVWAPLAKLMARVWDSPQTQAWALQADPLGYLQNAVGALPESELKTLLTQAGSPVVQAYLHYSQKPDSRLREQAFVKAMLRALKAQARVLTVAEQSENGAGAEAARVGLEKSLAAFSELSGSLKVLHGLALGTWEAGTAGAGKQVWVPNALVETGGKGAFGAYADMLLRLAVKIDTEQLELHRRRIFRSTAQAA